DLEPKETVHTSSTDKVAVFATKNPKAAAANRIIMSVALTSKAPSAFCAHAGSVTQTKTSETNAQAYATNNE
ncbi:hypothetical protein WICPIJ_009569, partial [Wickerhamomyces pijperi]